ncbi:MAG TPA: methyltransferase domain-containing protein [Candidatus Saccharimonadales bacterium]|nr:methyltransferase domain-containing protein [Candidatus Saccharimonadales bacterium]
MSKNDETLAAYEEHVNEYVAGTPRTANGTVKDWIDRALSFVPVRSTVLELGSAFGRDADYMESLGYKVQRTDAAKGFVNLLRGQGKDARVLNAITDDLGGPHAIVFANAVLLHFERTELQEVLQKVHAALAPGGVFAFTVKKGEGEEWSSAKLGAPRHFVYWQAEQLQSYLEAAGFVDCAIEDGSTTNAEWLQVIAHKSAV